MGLGLAGLEFLGHVEKIIGIEEGYGCVSGIEEHVDSLVHRGPFVRLVREAARQGEDDFVHGLQGLVCEGEVGDGGWMESAGEESYTIFGELPGELGLSKELHAH